MIDERDYPKLFKTFLYDINGGIIMPQDYLPKAYREDVLNDVAFEAQVVAGMDVVLVTDQYRISEADMILPETDLNANIGRFANTLFLLDFKFPPTFLRTGDAFEPAVVNLLTYRRYKFVGFGRNQFTVIY